MPTLDDILRFLIELLREPNRAAEIRNYGYDVYIPRVGEIFARDVERVRAQDPHAAIRRAEEISPVLYEAAWILCRRGILRPGVRRQREQVTDDGSGGNGYSITSQGRAWLAAAEQTVFIPVEPARVAELIGRFRREFGEGFFQRAQEAVRCHSSSAYLACCVMCGAAAESVLLSLAIAKVGNEEQVLATYRTAGGRGRVTQQVLQNVNARVATSFTELMALLNYWRDEAAHGIASEISEYEAYEALARLLRLAHFATDHRRELAGQ